MLKRRKKFNNKLELSLIYTRGYFAISGGNTVLDIKLIYILS